MAAGALVAVDRQILLFERWYRSEVKAVAGPQHAQALRQFTTWRLLPRMRARAANQFLTSGTRNAAAHEFSKARQYLVWLAGRGRCLQDSTQADIDAWYATATDPDATRTFLKWAIASRAMPRLDVPARRHAERAPISQHRRLAVIHRFLTDKRIELRTRVAGCLLLLYAQPVSRLARLTLDDIITGDDGQVFIRLGDPPTPGCQWLFPGQRVGQPLMPIGLRRQLHELGIPLTPGKDSSVPPARAPGPASGRRPLPRLRLRHRHRTRHRSRRHLEPLPGRAQGQHPGASAPQPGRGALTSRLTAVLRAAADGLPAGEAAQLTITRSDRVRWAAAVQYATAWAASSTGLL
jgi:hypothetical protein